MERYIGNKLFDYLDKFNILNNKQYGFQKGKGTITLLEDFADSINRNLDEGKHVVCIFVDFQKAFDSIDHEELICMLDRVGVRGHILTWFSSYLPE